MKALIKRIRRLLDTRRIRGQLRRVISIVACIVVFATTYALVLPAITMEAVARCGKEAHEHTAGCYEKVLICREPEADGHHHTDDCYRIEKVLDCNMEEHTHGPECRDAEGNLTCEKAEHTHDETCYRKEKELICGQKESEGHHHTDACYENKLICGKEVHIHSTECYENDEPAPEDDFFAGGDPADFTEDNSEGSTFTDAGFSDNEYAGDEFTDDGFADDGSADSEFTDNDFSDGGITFSDGDQEFTEPDGFDGAGEFIEASAPEDGSGFMETQGLEDGTVFEDPAYAEDGSYPEDPAADNQYDDTAYIEEIDDGAVPAAAGETLEDENADPAAADAETPGGTEAVNPDEAGVSTEPEENALNGDPAGQTAEEQNPDGSAAADIEAADMEKEAQSGEEAGEAGTEKTAEADSPDAAAKDGKTAQDGATEQDGKTTQDGATADTEKTGTASDKENTDGTDAASDKEKADGKETDAAEADTTLTDQTGADKEQDSFAAADQLQAPADLERFLTNRTGIWYYPAVFNEDGKADTADINSESVTDWKKVEDDTVLSPEDFVRIYLAYTLPAGTLSETNPAARYTLPSNLHLTPAQIEAINTHENGYYLSLGEDDVQAEVEQVKETLEDPADSPSEEDFAPGDQNAEEAIPSEEANAAAGPDVQGTERQDYLGAEAVEGERTPDQPLKDQKEEYISAVVKAEEIYDESGTFLGQELVFTFLPYTVEKNGNVYEDTSDSSSLDDAEPSDELIREGEAVTGFLTIDFATGQIDFEDTETENIKTAEITFAHENETEGTGFIHESLTMNSSAHFRKTQEIKTDQESEEIPVSGRTEEKTLDDKTTDGENNTSDEKDAGEEENKENTENKSGDSSDKDTERKEGADLPADAMPARTFEDFITLETARPASVGEIGTIAEAAGTLSAESEVRVRVEADEGTFPAGTTMVLSAVESKDMDAVAEAVENAVAANADTENKADGANTKSPKTCGFQAVDISFRDADGNEIEPSKPVRVVMTSSLIKEAAQNDTISAPVVVHVDNKGNGEQIDLVDPEKIEAAKGRTEEELIKEAEAVGEIEENTGAEDKKETEGKTESAQDTSDAATEEAEMQENDIEDRQEEIAPNTAKAEIEKASAEDSVGYETDRFSIYAIVYTVDFHWEVDGKTYDFSIPGGGFVNFENLVEILKITNIDLDEEKSEESGTDEDVSGKSDTQIMDNIEVRAETKRFIADIEKIEFSTPEYVWVGKAENNTNVGAIKKVNELEPCYSSALTEEQIDNINAQTVKAGDWVLISLQPFDTEEALTVMMKDGETFVIRTTDAMDSTSPYAKGTTFTAYDTRDDGFTINLFDYGPETTWDSKGLDNGGTNLSDKGGGYNSGINYNHTLKFTAYGKKPSEEKTNNQNILTWNHFSGTDAATQGIVENKLSNNYPKLNGGESLAYLFNTTGDGNNKVVYKDVYGLFQKDSDGKYFYDSNINYAYYNPDQGDSGSFQLSDTFPEEGSDWGVGFFPFNPWDGTKNCIHWLEYCPGTQGSNNKYYYNHHFGMTLEGIFQMTPNGMLNGKDMIFNFSGDDDLWVFIDDVLVLDIGGIHNPVGGNINFKTGKVTVNSAYNVNSVINDSVSGPAAITDIATCFQNAGKTWDNSAYSEHTIKVFYMERGGCYSNCAMEFNLTRFKDLEFDKKDQYGDPVEEAEFRLFKEDDTPLIETYIDYEDNNTVKEREYVRYSDADGHVKFDHVPVGTYYLKEITAPEGYIKDSSIYLAKITVSKSQDGTVSTVESYVLKNGQETDVITNIKQKNITLSLNKIWPGGAPDNASATFELMRYRSYEKEVIVPPSNTPCYFTVYRYKERNNPVKVGNTYELEGGSKVSVNWAYSYGYLDHDTNNREGAYKRDINQSGYFKKNNYAPLEIDLPVSGDASLYIRDDNINTFYGAGVINITVNGTEYVPGEPTTDIIQVENELDTDYHGPVKTLNSETGWAWEFEEQPFYGVRDGVLETYSYYIKETAHTPSDYVVAYDSMNGEDIAGSTDSETRIITNMKKIDIPVIKSWNWSEEDEDQAANWDATFALEWREVLERGEADPDAQHTWTEVDGVSQKTIQKGDTGEDIRFENLPMYRIHSNGSLYRIIYAVDEVAYNVYDSNNSIIASWTKSNPQVTVGTLYAPDYEQDAGELDQPENHEDWDEWYTIHLTNAVSEKTVTKTIDLDVYKIWEGDEDNSILNSDSAYAKFQLMRFVHEEYRDYNKGNIDLNTLVTVTLDLGNGSQTELTVPKGAPVHIAGVVKPGKIASLAFLKPDNTTVQLQQDNSENDKPVYAATEAFLPQSDMTLHFDNGDVSTIIGGLDGLRLAYYDDKQAPDLDETFEHEPAGQIFTLRKADHWQKDWIDLPQIVEGKLNPETRRQTVYFYSYYLKEIECSPDNYRVVFKDSMGEILGDATSPIDFSTSITAENHEITEASVEKIWNDNNDSAHKRPASLTVNLMADGIITDKTVTLSNENSWTDTISGLPKYNNGVEIDYYWHEGIMPDGYFLTSASVNGTITTLTNSLSDYDLWTDYSGTKTWNDEENRFNTRPHELHVTLYASKALMNPDGTVKTDESGNIVYGQPEQAPYPIVWDTTVTPWEYNFDHLPVFDENGNVIKYFAEETVPGSYIMTSVQTPTKYTLGTIWTDNGSQYIQNKETQSVLEWQMSSMIDLPFVVVKNTSGRPAYIWSPRVPTPAEKAAIFNYVKTLHGWHIPNPVENTTWYVSSTVIENPGHGNVTVEFDPENLLTKLVFSEHDNWAQFIIGQLKIPAGEDKYNIGTTAFTNVLDTISLTGTKTWIIEGVTNPDNPVLMLTRTYTITDPENNQTRSSEPETVTVVEGDSIVPLQPAWSGDGLTRSFSYTGLPKANLYGNVYTYNVSEASFTVGSGEDKVTYMAVRNADGTYTVTADKEGAKPVTIKQNGNNIINGAVEADIEIIKVEKGHKDSNHTLSGAKFRLTRVNDTNNNNMTGDDAYQSEIVTVDSVTGKVIFEDLKPGRYKLEEMGSPDGYVLVETPWFIMIDTSGTATLEAEYTMASEAEEENSFYIENEPGAELPSTGGPGTRLIYMLGAMLVMLGGAVLLFRTRMNE